MTTGFKIIIENRNSDTRQCWNIFDNDVKTFCESIEVAIKSNFELISQIGDMEYIAPLESNKILKIKKSTEHINKMLEEILEILREN